MSVSPGPSLPSDVTAHTLATGPFELPIIWQGLLVGSAVAAFVLFRRGTPPQEGDPWWRRLTRRQRERQPMMSRLIIVGTLLFLSAVFVVNDYVGYVRTPNDLAELMERGNGWSATMGEGLAALTAPKDHFFTQLPGRHGGHDAQPAAVTGPPQLMKVNLPDTKRGVPVGAANVLLPPGYNSPATKNVRYPVVYLIHGYPDGNADDWLTSGDALSTVTLLMADHLIAPMIIVAPDMTAEQPSVDFECLNIPNGPQLEDYLVDTVVPGIDAKFRTVADRQHRALGGMSGGAYCALNIGLQHLAQFGSLLLTLPYDDLGDSAPILGSHTDLIVANTPRHYIPTMQFSYPVSVIITAGGAAPTDVTTMHRLADSLSARGQHVDIVVQPGMQHTWRTARAALPYMLVFANQVFTAAGNAAPPKNTSTTAPPPSSSTPSKPEVTTSNPPARVSHS